MHLCCRRTVSSTLTAELKSGVLLWMAPSSGCNSPTLSCNCGTTPWDHTCTDTVDTSIRMYGSEQDTTARTRIPWLALSLWRTNSPHGKSPGEAGATTSGPREKDGYDQQEREDVENTSQNGIINLQKHQKYRKEHGKNKRKTKDKQNTKAYQKAKTKKQQKCKGKIKATDPTTYTSHHNSGSSLDAVTQHGCREKL